jgi:hypothetical protein
MTSHFQRTLIASAVLAACAPALAQQSAAGDAAGTSAATVIVIGSRMAAKSALDTVVPVGLIDQKDLQSAGTPELGKVLQELDPRSTPPPPSSATAPISSGRRPFPQMGFTYCWETCPFGLNGRSLYAKADYSF